METNLDLRGQLLSVEKEIKQLIGKRAYEILPSLHR